MSTLNVLVIGGSGGIGAELIRQYQLWSAATGQPTQIYATYHNHEPRAESGVNWLHLDLRSTESIALVGEQLQQLQQTQQIQALDHWICCSGYLHGEFGEPEKAMKSLHGEKLLGDFAVNSIGPLLMLQSSLGLLKKSPLAKAAFLSAQVGSIEDNRSGGWYGYRMSKAALNMGIRCAAIECARWRQPPIIVALHPGTTLSGLSQPFTARRSPAPQSAHACAQDLLALINRLTLEHNGQFLRLNGEVIPW